MTRAVILKLMLVVTNQELTMFREELLEMLTH